MFPQPFEIIALFSKNCMLCENNLVTMLNGYAMPISSIVNIACHAGSVGIMNTSTSNGVPNSLTRSGLIDVTKVRSDTAVLKSRAGVDHALIAGLLRSGYHGYCRGFGQSLAGPFVSFCT